MRMFVTVGAVTLQLGFIHSLNKIKQSKHPRFRRLAFSVSSRNILSWVHPTKQILLLTSDFRCVLNAVCFLLGIPPASEFYMPTFRHTVPCDKTSAYKIQTPGNYPEASIQQSKSSPGPSRILPSSPDGASLQKAMCL